MLRGNNNAARASRQGWLYSLSQQPSTNVEWFCFPPTQPPGQYRARHTSKGCGWGGHSHPGRPAIGTLHPFPAPPRPKGLHVPSGLLPTSLSFCTFLRLRDIIGGQRSGLLSIFVFGSVKSCGTCSAWKNGFLKFVKLHCVFRIWMNDFFSN